MMRKGNIIQALCCLLLCSCYLMAVVGFDVHTDHHDDRTYVVSLLSNISCEKIHPEDDCACGDCDHDDCEDESDYLTVTGSGDFLQQSVPVPAVMACEVIVPESAISAPAFSAPLARPFRSPPRVVLNSLCVLRV